MPNIRYTCGGGGNLVSMSALSEQRGPNELALMVCASLDPAACGCSLGFMANKRGFEANGEIQEVTAATEATGRRAQLKCHSCPRARWTRKGSEEGVALYWATMHLNRRVHACTRLN
jgi:hypothetical protein